MHFLSSLLLLVERQPCWSICAPTFSPVPLAKKKKKNVNVKQKQQATAAPGIPAWSPTAVLTRRHRV